MYLGLDLSYSKTCVTIVEPRDGMFGVRLIISPCSSLQKKNMETHIIASYQLKEFLEDKVFCCLSQFDAKADFNSNSSHSICSAIEVPPHNMRYSSGLYALHAVIYPLYSKFPHYFVSSSFIHSVYGTYTSKSNIKSMVMSLPIFNKMVFEILKYSSFTSLPRHIYNFKNVDADAFDSIVLSFYAYFLSRINRDGNVKSFALWFKLKEA